MKLSPSRCVSACLSLAAALSLSTLARAQSVPDWEAFNDYSPGPLTHTNATGYKVRIAGDGGVLKDFATGLDLPVLVTVETDGGSPDDFGARGGAPVAGSPARLLFDGKVDLANDGLPGVRATVKLTLLFSGLNPSKQYKFCGTVARGGSYNNRWSVFTLTGVSNAVAAHLDGSLNQNIFTAATYPTAAADLGTNQVALNAGHNLQGSVVCWDKIEPAADGTFRVEALRYLGKTPFGDAPNAGTSYSYGLEAFSLAEFASSGNLHVTQNPVSQKVPAGSTATFTVAATSMLTITNQWQKAAPGSTNFVKIGGANQATYTTPVLTVADDGSKFRCQLSSGSDRATSGEATLTVDGVVPIVVSVIGSINFNSAYVTFSEPMKLAPLANLANYQLSGGLSITSAIALDSTTVRLLTSSTQSVATTYSLNLTNLEDVAGNKLAPNTTASFKSFALATNTVGVEIWKNIGGSAVTDLRNDARYPASPDVDYAAATLNSLLVVPAMPDLNTYGGRFRAWLTPDQGGDYEFFLRADDQGEFRISSDDKFDTLDDINITANAVDTTTGDPFQEPGVDLSTTAPISLAQGQRYAIQAIWKEANGGDHCQVAWRKVGDLTPADQLQPIPTRFLSYYGPGVLPLPRINAPIVQGGLITIQWINGGTLESSPTLTNPTWTSTGNSTGSYSEPVGGASKFYRVRR